MNLHDKIYNYPTKHKEGITQKQWQELLFYPFFEDCDNTGQCMDKLKQYGGELGQWIYELPMYKFEFFGKRVMIKPKTEDIFFID